MYVCMVCMYTASGLYTLLDQTIQLRMPGGVNGSLIIKGTRKGPGS